MAGGFHIYYEAARALWSMPTHRLEEMAAKGEPAHRRAALTTLRVKAEFMTPEAFASERAAVTKVASSLAQDPEYTMDKAIKQTGGKIQPLAADRSRPPRRRMKTTTWVAITAGVLLLILDVLATAGVPVPTPIGDVIDRFTGTDESPITPAPPPPGSKPGLVREPKFVSEVPPSGLPAAVRPTTTPSARSSSEDRDAGAWAPNAERTKNPNHANGRERNPASARELRRAGGRSAHRPPDPGRSKRERPVADGKPDHAGGKAAQPPKNPRAKDRPHKKR